MNTADLEEELRMAQRTLQHLRLQIAKKGISTPPDVLIDAEDTEKHIARLERALGREVTEPRQLPQVERPAPRYAPPRDYERERAAERQRDRQRDIDHQLGLLSIHRRNLAILRAQAEAHGGWKFAPTHVKNQMIDAQASIAQIKRALDTLGAAYDNLPGDE